MRRRVSLAAIRARRFLRRPPRPRWYWPVMHVCGIAFGLLFGLGLGAWLGGSGTMYLVVMEVTNRALTASADAGLAVKEVYADGRLRTDREELHAHLGFTIGTPILAVDTTALKTRLETLPWIEQASVGRYLPDTIQIRLVERTPLALWQHQGHFSLIDRDGEIIVSDLDALEVAKGFGHLRVLVGEGAPMEAQNLFRMLSTEPKLSARVIAATWVGDRRWTLRLDNHIDVLLPESAPREAWTFLAKKARDDALLDRAITIIDLRELPERMRLRLDPVALSGERA